METFSIHTESANLSEEQFFRLCADNKELRLERDKNKNIIVMSPMGFKTSNFESKIFSQLILWNNNKNEGYVTGPSGGYILPDGSMRAPDAAWIKKERIDSLTNSERDKFPKLCPDFIIEVRSQSDTLKQQQEKMQEWIANGCRLGWLIDLENNSTYIYKPSSSITEKSFAETLLGEEVLQGFELTVSEIIN